MAVELQGLTENTFLGIKLRLEILRLGKRGIPNSGLVSHYYRTAETWTWIWISYLQFDFTDEVHNNPTQPNFIFTKFQYFLIDILLLPISSEVIVGIE